MFAAESLVPFFNVYASVLSGKRLYQELQTFNATAEVKVALEKNLWLLEENLRNMLLEPQIKAIFCLPPLTHATDAVRLCTSDKCTATEN